MSNFELDFAMIDQVVTEKPIDRLPVKGNEGRMVRIAFDLFRLDGDNREELWQVQADDDGNEFLVRTYNLPEEEDAIQKSSKWEVYLDKKAANLTIAYNGVPIERLATAKYGVTTPDEANIFKSTVMRKLATDEGFVDLILNNMPQEKLNMMGDMGDQCESGCPLESGTMPPMPGGGVILIVDENEAKNFSEKPSKKEDKKEESPSEDFTDADNWWENLSDKEKDELFDKFKDAPSITKEQAFKLFNLELKLAKQAN